MSVLPIQPIPFFANKDRAFWRLQIIGWGGAMLLRTMSALANNQSIAALALVLIATITGFSISLILSVIFRTLIRRRAIVTWGMTLVFLPLAVGLHAFIDAWVVSLVRPDSDASFTQLFLGVFYFDATLLGAWTALYYMVNFYLQVEEQNDQLIRLENQATSAQLAMLRYQLNPHFLFNTLNSISTLVLLKQTEPANAMLSRLSSFLRYTLVNKPSARVTVALEVETLQLYLDIERMLRGAAAHHLRHRSRHRDRTAALAAAPAAGRERDQICGQPAGGGSRDHGVLATRRADASHHRLGHRAGLAKPHDRQQVVGHDLRWRGAGIDRRGTGQHPRPPVAGLRRAASLRDGGTARGRFCRRHRNSRRPPRNLRGHERAHASARFGCTMKQFWAARVCRSGENN
jgi:hypothetical protein